MPEKLYLDTSVISAFFDTRTPWRQRLTHRFWKYSGGFHLTISELVTDEIYATRSVARRNAMLRLVSNVPTIYFTPEARSLARVLIKERVLPRSCLDDALHLAIATTEACEFLLSWNYDHLVNVERKRLYREAALMQKYRPVEVATPAEIGGKPKWDIEI